MALFSIIRQVILRRKVRFLLAFSLIMIFSASLPIIAIMVLYSTEVSRVVPVLGEAWYLRISVGEPTAFTRLIERLIPFWRYPIFAVEFGHPFAPKAYYTYENLLTALLLATTMATLVCVSAEMAPGGGGLKASGTSRKGRAGLFAAPLLQACATAYGTAVGCATCYGSLALQLTMAGATVVITTTMAAYLGYMGLLAGLLVASFLIYRGAKRLERLGWVKQTAK